MAAVPPPAPNSEVAILVDVVCPDRLARQGFAVAPFPIRVPAVALLSLSSLFAALKLGALADETEVKSSVSLDSSQCSKCDIRVGKVDAV